MRSTDVSVHDHRIRIAFSVWNAKEVISHDGTIVSECRSFRLVTPHSFTVQEGGEAASYVVRNAGPVGYAIWRNGTLVAERQQRWMRLFLSAALVFAVVMVIGVVAWAVEIMTDGSFASIAQAVDDWAAPIAIVLAFPVSWWFKNSVTGRHEGTAPPMAARPT